MAEILNSLDSSGYNNAEEYYLELKNKMLNEIFEKKKLKNLSDNAAEHFTDFINDKLTSTIASDWATNFKISKEMLSTLRKLAGQMTINEETQNLIAGIDNTARKKTRSATLQEKQIKTALTKQSENVLKTLNLDKTFFENMIRTQVPNADVSDIVDHSIAYFTREIYTRTTSRAEKLTPNIFARALSLSGFYKEAAEYEALKEIIASYSNLNVFHAGAKKTELDIVISNLENVDEIFNKNITITRSLAEATLDPKILKQILLQEVAWYGAQVKSYKLDSAMSYKIGSRKELFNTFLDGRKRAYNSLEGAIFLSRFKNILLALGPTNVMFITGNQRQWMHEFIHSFRQKNYVLAFLKPNDNSALTEHVGIEKYITQKGNIRQRYMK